jgi:hypothetical protein
MSHFESRPNFSANRNVSFSPKAKPASKPPFEVDLCCNINIEVHVAMRLGELIKASRTEDKQLMALGCQLASAMERLVNQLDDRQWDRISTYMDEQEQDDAPGSEYPDDYVSKARRSFPNSSEDYIRHEEDYKSESSAKTPLEMKELVSSIMSKK